VTGLNLDANEYAFCVKARNGDNTETAFGATNSNNGGYTPLTGNFTVTSDMTFTNVYSDATTSGRWVGGLDHGSGTTNDSVLTIQSGVLSIGSTQTIAAGSIVFPTQHGSIAIASGGQIKTRSTPMGEGSGRRSLPCHICHLLRRAPVRKRQTPFHTHHYGTNRL